MNFSASFDVILTESDDEHELWFSSLCSFSLSMIIDLSSKCYHNHAVLKNSEVYINAYASTETYKSVRSCVSNQNVNSKRHYRSLKQSSKQC